MNKYLISLNVILLVAVIVLFCLFFNKKNNSNQSNAAPIANRATSASGFKIGYFELDSLDNNYKYEQAVKNELIEKDKEVDKQINDLQNQVQERYNEIAKKGATLSQAEQTEYSKELNDLSKQNQDKAQRLQQSVGMERNMKLQEVKQRIQIFLKTYAKDNGYNYIIGTYETDNFYYKDSAQDITAELVQKLNDSYSNSLKNAAK